MPQVFQTYRKIPITSPRLIFVQTAFSLGLFSGELIFEGACYWKEFCVSKWVGFCNKNSLKHYENSVKELVWAYIQVDILSEGFLRVRFEGLIFGRAYLLINFFFFNCEVTFV